MSLKKFIEDNGWIKYDVSMGNPIKEPYFQVICKDDLDDENDLIPPDLYASMPSIMSSTFFDGTSDVVYYKEYNKRYYDRHNVVVAESAYLVATNKTYDAYLNDKITG